MLRATYGGELARGSVTAEVDMDTLYHISTIHRHARL